MKRVLFLPNDLGGGRGHVSRCIYLAKQTQAAGLSAAIALGDKYLKHGLDAGLETLRVRWLLERLRKYQWKKPHKPFLRPLNPPVQRPVFVQFNGLDYQVPRDGFLSEKLVRLRFKRLCRLLETFKPEYLVGDTHLLTHLLGRHFQIPVIQITRQAGFPPRPNFLWWQRSAFNGKAPHGLAPFRGFWEQAALTGDEPAEALLRGDLYLIPADKQIEPIRNNDFPLLFTGPMSERSSFRQNIPFFEVKNEYPRIYVTIGGGAERGQLERFFNRLIELFDKAEFRVLVSTGKKIAAKTFANRSANMFFVDWVDGMSAIEQSDLVIHHGGYGTTMETLIAGRPSVIIPSHSEQEGNGRRLEKLGVGRLLLPFDDEPQPLEFEWTFGRYSMLASYRLHLQREQLFEAINELLYNDAYVKLRKISARLQKLQKEFDIFQIIKGL